MGFFASDNTSGASDEILQAMTRANGGDAKAYGGDAGTELLTAKFRELFAHPELTVFPAFNGSAANCLGLAGVMRPHEAVIVHQHSHMEQDECGMPEFFTGGKLLKAVGGEGKITPEQAETVIDLARANGIHHSRPKVISVTQSTEFGTVYKPHELAALSALAKQHNLLMHMDGARFANAVASLGCKPADISWKAGVDVMSFGATKNGAVLAEAVIFFKPELVQDFGRIRKRAGQLASKQRFISAQLVEIIEKDLWIRNATHANAMAARLAQGIAKIPQLRILNDVEANGLFVQMPAALAQGLMDKGHYFYDWPLYGKNTYRLVTSFSTTAQQVDELLADLVKM